ncbi:ParB/RepB/Spo0J family partition protein [Superficieibacter sp.]|uniref:IbrB-like domain-containing protein n=1 Tax=Superficieibacter sp. TaxID=2303322 RepID=UPI0028A7D863|nr:ParB/RepB/Spo0J family partition protein [Superficieibacter sp.]
MQQRIMQVLAGYLDKLSEKERIAAINNFRLLLHEFSPFRDNPVDCVLWMKHENLTPNNYNPNNVAPPENRLLLKSLETDGFTQPIVVSQNGPDQYEIVDGFHRHQLAKNKNSLIRELKGYVPVSRLNHTPEQRASSITSTIRHNRARGRHQINAMAEIVRELAQLNWSEEKIGKELGMDADEVLRLKQINGLLELFSDRKFSEAWTVK